MKMFTRSREAAKIRGSRGGAEARSDVATAPVARQRDPYQTRPPQDEKPLTRPSLPPAHFLRVSAPPREQSLLPSFRGFAASREKLFLLAPLALTACATQIPGTVAHAPATPGFLLGLWHGFIFPVAWVLSLFLPDVAVYAVPNTGGWYDFGYFLGIVVFGVGARKSRTVYVTRRRG